MGGGWTTVAGGKAIWPVGGCLCEREADKARQGDDTVGGTSDAVGRKEGRLLGRHEATSTVSGTWLTTKACVDAVDMVFVRKVEALTVEPTAFRARLGTCCYFSPVVDAHRPSSRGGFAPVDA